MPDPAKYHEGTELPWLSGTRPADEIFIDDIPPPAGHAPGLVYTLDYISKDGLVLYNPALLLLVGYDPVSACWAENGWDVKDAPYMVPLPEVVFEGAPDPYDRTVFACRADKAGGLFRYLDRMRVGIGTGWDSVRQTMAVSDPMTPIGMKAPLVPVHVYGLRGATEAVLWEMKSRRGLSTLSIRKMLAPPGFGATVEFTRL